MEESEIHDLDEVILIQNEVKLENLKPRKIQKVSDLAESFDEDL